MTSLCARFIVFWVTLAGVIVICLYGVEESKLLIKELDDVRNISKCDVKFRESIVSKGFPLSDLQVGCGLQGKQDCHPDPGICWVLWSKEKLVNTAEYEYRKS